MSATTTTTTTLEHVTVRNQLDALSNVSIFKDLKVQDDVIINGNAGLESVVVSSGSATISKNLLVPLSLKTTTLSVNESVNTKTLVVHNDLTLSGPTRFVDASSISGDLSLLNNAKIDGNLSVTGSTIFTQNPIPTDAPVLTYITGTLTSAQIKTLHTTPVTIVPAPGPGKSVMLSSFALYYERGTISYTGGSSLSIGYSANTYFSNLVTGLLTSAASTFVSGTSEHAFSYDPVLVTNLPLRIHESSGTPYVNGNGILKYQVFYDTFTV